PDRGEVLLDGVDAASLPAQRRNRIRCRDVGFVFQFYHLLPELNVLDNVLLPARTRVGVLQWPRLAPQARKQAMELLDRLGLSDRLKHRPRELSGGEQQRVAIARALINRPRLLLADEPTGNLDSRTGTQILKLIKQLNDDTGQTIVMVTHDQALADMADRVLHLRDGKLQ
ncbi:MAG TPA: ABC transporter ATP-binding protein, partial [Phycisphaerae bacterium]|nr:ABC transporter ATP-binding protein [Phycisphaerae bacterium]